MSNYLSIKGRVAIVTGSSSGNGRAIALALASEGAKVVCSDLNPGLRPGGFEKDSTPTHELIAKTGQAVFKNADVSSEEDIKGLVGFAVEVYGRLDILVNNAGITIGYNKIVDESTENFDKIMLVNARGVFHGMKYAITQMMKQDPLPSGERGWIVNIASIGGLVGIPEISSYSASKGAVVSLTRQVAIDYAPERIHVNAVCPGFIETAMSRDLVDHKETNERMHSQSPWPHLGTAEDVAKTVLFLASDAASWTTGSILNVDGGFCTK